MASNDSTNLRKYLVPNSTNKVPNVLDEDGNVVTYGGSSRLTNENTVVDLGDSPNSNTGDPLRVAFIKLNNFIEASYHVNQAIDSEIQVLNKTIDGGFY